GRISEVRRAKFSGQSAAFGERLETEGLGCARCSRQRHGREADRTAPEHGHASARLEACGAREHPLVGHAHRLGHPADFECGLLMAVPLEDVVERPAVLRVDTRVFGEATVDRESEILDVATLIPIPPATAITFTAPLNLLRGDEVADRELLDIAADGDNL